MNKYWFIILTFIFLSFLQNSFSNSHHLNRFAKAQQGCSDSLDGWQQLDRSAQAEVLGHLDYAEKEDLPEGTDIATYVESENGFSLSRVSNTEHKAYIEKILTTFDREVCREAIEQSPFQAYGEEQIIGLYLLVNCEGKPLGSLIYKFQDGRDENGEEGDINWSVFVRFDHAGEIFTALNGTPYDELSFAWSGH